MDKNVTMKILSMAITAVTALVGIVYSLTVNSQGQFNTRIEGRVDSIYEIVNKNQTEIINKLSEIKETTGRMDERLKNIERK